MSHWKLSLHTSQLNNGLSHKLTHVAITQSKVKINHYAKTERCICFVLDKIWSFTIKFINISYFTSWAWKFRNLCYKMLNISQIIMWSSRVNNKNALWIKMCVCVCVKARVVLILIKRFYSRCVEKYCNCGLQWRACASGRYFHKVAVMQHKRFY